MLLPVFAVAQSKKKRLKAEQQARMERMTVLQNHVKFLADDQLEGRRTGTQGEEKAMQYIIDQYKQMGLSPAGTDGFIQTFAVQEGRLPDSSTQLSVGGRSLSLMKEFFPLPYSPATRIKGSSAMALHESGEPWFWDLRELLEANTGNPAPIYSNILFG